MGPLHTYSVDVDWSGEGTTSYTSYSRDHRVRIEGKPDLLGSSEPAFRGNEQRYSPEDLFVASLAQCHMLWFLHKAALAGVVVVDYHDRAAGTMRVETAGAGQFIEVVLHPKIVAKHPVDQSQIADLHADAHAHCFLARSVNFPVRLAPLATQVVDSEISRPY